MVANDSTLWAVNGPVETDARQPRHFAHSALGGQTGIIGPLSCEVLAQPTPNNTVRILPGGFCIEANHGGGPLGYPEAPRQMYVHDLMQTISQEIDPTDSSGGRIDVVGIVIDDPQFEGTTELIDWETHRFWRPHVAKGVSSIANRPQHFPEVGRPFLPLARVTIPASTATITQDMITDIRFLAVERTKFDTIVQRPDESRTLTTSNASDYVSLDQIRSIIIPQWATHVKLDGEIIGCAATGSGDVNGRVRFVFSPGTGNKYTGSVPFNESNAWSRFTLPAFGTIPLDDNERGRRSFFRFQVQRTTGSGGLSIASHLTAYKIRVTFVEDPITS
ncbi:hypothetical protein [Nesterenkonia sp. CL21]|uniref:hypothetical protein n=1 Tax=unclassified Nesterenkonia TaxID=2629769 RepID=UPI00287A7F6B|nr:hypothetical protein [Nesterenkonia sp. CL21]MDS2172528.1 hypothetical protein [Nesterenkonia sp. CL21]